MKRYDVMKQGTITAVRIRDNMEKRTVEAELAFAFGGSEVIDWNCTMERAMYIPGITGYTLIFDERTKNSKEFEAFVK